MRAWVESSQRLQSTRRPRVCHGGTLDPFASGLLLLLVEPANRLFDYLHAIPKRYEATIRWGVETDNGDLHGRGHFSSNFQINRPQCGSLTAVALCYEISLHRFYNLPMSRRVARLFACVGVGAGLPCWFSRRSG